MSEIKAQLALDQVFLIVQRAINSRNVTHQIQRLCPLSISARDNSASSRAKACVRKKICVPFIILSILSIELHCSADPGRHASAETGDLLLRWKNLGSIGPFNITKSCMLLRTILPDHSADTLILAVPSWSGAMAA